MEEMKTIEGGFDLGTWLGRRQAFGLVAGRCSAADAECLIQIKEHRLYLAVEDTWEDFCVKRLGISRATADRAIRQFQQLGPNYARLNSFTRIKPADYRLIAAAVSEDGVSYGGEIIPMEPEQAPQLAHAVEALRREHAPEPEPVDPAAQSFARAEKSLQTVLAEFQRLQVLNLDPESRLKLALTVENVRNQLDQILLSTGF